MTVLSSTNMIKTYYLTQKKLYNLNFNDGENIDCSSIVIKVQT